MLDAGSGCRVSHKRRVMIKTKSFSPHIFVVLAVIAFSAFPTTSKAAYEYEKFVGEYMGEGMSQTDHVLQKRDMKVEIKPNDEGFILSWVSVSHNDDGTLKRKTYDVQFKPKGRTGLYGSAMRADMFGHEVPLDPLKGEPYVWARISGDTLFVYAMLIIEEGGYEMQVYERTLTPGGMDLIYSSVRDGRKMRTVHGKLKRVN
ncbi:MAG: hypothetical protein OER43_06420 [Gammaproteobacteria bacterium]|nr:hypothetical protein [Gammaproteobacteria bacterium]MDH3411390.1 hypothetical protein [Gammaproteobacteria bacterium]